MAQASVRKVRESALASAAGEGGFCLDAQLIQAIFEHAKPLGHHEVPANLNLGFGFLYYGLVRTLRPSHVVVIGSGFGFSVVCLALAMRDNRKGRLSFVDPSYSVLADGPFKTMGGTSQWDDPEKVTQHFARFGVDRLVTHYRMRSEEFFSAYPALNLPAINVAFIDGNHSFTNVRQDFRATLQHAGKNAYVLLHDTNIYVRELLRHAGVKRWVNILKRESSMFEVIDFPFSSGVAIVRVLEEDAWKSLGPASPR